MKRADEIKVTIHIPGKIPENVKQQRINRLYDILKPKNKKSDNNA